MAQTIALEVTDVATQGNSFTFEVTAIVIDRGPVEGEDVTFFLDLNEIGSEPTDERGRAKFPYEVPKDTLSGKKSVLVEAETSTHQRRSRRVSLPHEQTKEVVKKLTLVVSEPQERNGTVSVNLTGLPTEDSKPAPNIVVLFYLYEELVGRATSDRNGRAGITTDFSTDVMRGDELHFAAIWDGTGSRATESKKLRKKEEAKKPLRKLQSSVSATRTSTDAVTIKVWAKLTEDGGPVATEQVLFRLYGDIKGRGNTDSGGDANCTFAVPVNEIHDDKIIVQVNAGGLTEEATATLPKKPDSGSIPAADKLIVRADGKDGKHTVYIDVIAQNKKPVPGIHVVIKNTVGEEVFRGITNDRGVIFPHPSITLQSPGIHYFMVIAEGTGCDPERLRLDGPPRYPKPPEPPLEIPPEERGYIGGNPFKAMISGWRAGRNALREQRRQR